MTNLTTDQKTTMRIVTRQKGSWRWQDAYGVVEYTTALTKCGKKIWKSHRNIINKASMPQLIKMGFGNLSMYSLHNKSAD